LVTAAVAISAAVGLRLRSKLTLMVMKMPAKSATQMHSSTRCCARYIRSNMSKLGRGGKPILRDDGKVIKSELCFPPDIAAVLSQQVQRPTVT
jgi:hypothetical protein